MGCAGATQPSTLSESKRFGLRTQPNDAVLEWAAKEDRIVLTHDYATMPFEAFARVSRGLSMPGVFMVPDDLAAGRAIDDLHLAATASLPDEFRDAVKYFPL